MYGLLFFVVLVLGGAVLIFIILELGTGRH